MADIFLLCFPGSVPNTRVNMQTGRECRTHSNARFLKTATMKEHEPRIYFHRKTKLNEEWSEPGRRCVASKHVRNGSRVQMRTVPSGPHSIQSRIPQSVVVRSASSDGGTCLEVGECGEVPPTAKFRPLFMRRQHFIRIE